MDINNVIKKANLELKANKVGIGIKRRNKSLYLRGTLPPLIKGSIEKEAISIGEAIALFKKHFWNRRSPDNLKAQTTLKGDREVLYSAPALITLFFKTVYFNN